MFSFPCSLGAGHDSSGIKVMASGAGFSDENTRGDTWLFSSESVGDFEALVTTLDNE